MAGLLQWVAAQGERARVAADAVDPVSDQSSASCGAADRTIYALRAIRKHEELVTLRDGAFLNGSSWLRRVEATWSEKESGQLRADLARLQPSGTVLSALALLAEKARGEKSSFHGYLVELPAVVPLPLAWSDEGRALLKGSAAYPIMDHDLVQSVYDRFVRPLADGYPQLWGKAEVQFDAFRWAFSIVSSRAFSLDDSNEPTLLPVIDMANHDPTNPAAVINRDDTGSYQLVAARDIDAGAPVTISYGALSNAQLLCRYGFTLPETNASDSILLSGAHVRLVFAQLTCGGTVDAALAQLENLVEEEAVSASRVVGTGDDGGEPAVKRRKLFAASEPVTPDDSISFALHADATMEFGLADGLMGFVFANDLPMEALYDALSVLLQQKDKAYSALLGASKDAFPPVVSADELRLARALVALERQVCRRILLGLASLEEDSDEEGDEGDKEEEDESDS